MNRPRAMVMIGSAAALGAVFAIAYLFVQQRSAAHAARGAALT